MACTSVLKACRAHNDDFNARVRHRIAEHAFGLSASQVQASKGVNIITDIPAKYTAPASFSKLAFAHFELDTFNDTSVCGLLPRAQQRDAAFPRFTLINKATVEVSSS